MKVLLLTTLLFITCSLSAQTVGSFVDQRDGQEYKTITYQVGKKRSKTSVTWMAENLDYEIEGAYYRLDSTGHAMDLGRLYTWPIAIKACPAGWHLPTDEDWTTLVNLYGGMEAAGRHFKSDSDLWTNQGKGTNKSLFNAEPNGAGDGISTYPNFGRNAIFWSANDKDEEYAWDWILVTGWKKIMRSDGHKLTTANSVRCVKNSDQ